MKFIDRTEKIKESYTGELVGQWLKKAYQRGIDDLAKELKTQLEIESKKNQKITQSGILIAIAILENTISPTK